MERMLIGRNLEYHVFTTNHPALAERELFEKVYLFWHEQWSRTFSELVGLEKLYSDDFLRHQEKTFLTYRGEVVAYFGLNWYDLNLLSHRSHSYFKVYPVDALDFLHRQDLKRVMTMGFLCADSKWRRSQVGLLVADCIVSLAYRRFKYSEADTLISFTRNNRKIDEMGYRNGSRTLKAGVKQYNVDVDFIYTLKNEVRESEDLTLRRTVDRLWDSRILHGEQQSSDFFNQTKKAA